VLGVFGFFVQHELNLCVSDKKNKLTCTDEGILYEYIFLDIFRPIMLVYYSMRSLSIELLLCI
jgi:hypothetical protein